MKPGYLRDDLVEDITHRERLSKAGIDEGSSLRITPLLGSKVERPKLIATGHPQAVDMLSRVLTSRKRIELEAKRVETYPDDPSFDLSRFRAIALPLFSQSLQALRNRLAVPADALEDTAISIERGLQNKITEWFGRPGESTEAVEVDKATK
ncbi:hypothetical protein ACFLX5_06040 [Chloroflexota bacterium]